VPVCGMVYLVHFTGCAETVDTEAASANASATRVVFIAFPPAISGEKASRAYLVPPPALLEEAVCRQCYLQISLKLTTRLCRAPWARPASNRASTIPRRRPFPCWCFGKADRSHRRQPPYMVPHIGDVRKATASTKNAMI